MDVRDSGVCAGKDCIFVVGGRQKGESAYEFNLETQEWTDLPNMSNSRRSPGISQLFYRKDKSLTQPLSPSNSIFIHRCDIFV